MCYSRFFAIILLGAFVPSALGSNFTTMEPNYFPHANNNIASTQASDNIEFKVELQRAINELDLHDQCNFFRTDKLRNACQHIANNQAFKTSGRDGVDYQSSGCTSLSCPTLQGAVKPITTENSVHSLSPWTVCENTDMSR